MRFRSVVAGSAFVAAALIWSQTKPTVAQSPAPAPEATQTIDERYTQIIRQHLQDPRITTELLGFNAITNWNDLDAGKASTSNVTK